MMDEPKLKNPNAIKAGKASVTAKKAKKAAFISEIELAKKKRILCHNL